MFTRNFSILAALSCVSLLGCSSPGGSESVEETQTQAVTSSCISDCVTGDMTETVDDTNAPIFQFAISGYSVDSVTGTATIHTTLGTSILVNSTTRVKHSPLGVWLPGDPMYPNAQAWNTLVQNAPQPATFGAPTALEGATFSSLMLQFANYSKHVRVKLDSTGTTALSLRPLP